MNLAIRVILHRALRPSWMTGCCGGTMDTPWRSVIGHPTDEAPSGPAEIEARAAKRPVLHSRPHGDDREE